MILLGKEKYEEVKEPLETVTLNNLFARSVVEKQVSGEIYVDNETNPETFYIIHPYGMSLLFGDLNNSDFNAKFRVYALNLNQTRNRHEWMQVFPKEWDAVLNDLLKDSIVKSSDNAEDIKKGIVEINTRINFKFNLDKYLEFKKNNINHDLRIVRTDKNIFTDMKGTVVPIYFWDSANDFYGNGIGFSLYHENSLASTAFSAFIHDNMLELGMETIEEFRGRGFAQHTCSALIDYCLENNYEPIWACGQENIGSYKLALKLGFEPAGRFSYYRLSD
ncbi:MAG: GNAT family N-acetyltransferase [Methanobacteriaceae archaeon]|jgi:GNAT superfamily N-acetyltransferase|nr:GNAT family N-acetyltransferase [Methanobacteriaceae archaeon]